MIVSGIVILILGLILFFVDYIKEKTQIISFCSGLVVASSIIMIWNSPSETEPTALDVYNNKTILQVTYVDSMPTDTVVVFKEEFK